MWYNLIYQIKKGQYSMKTAKFKPEIHLDRESVIPLRVQIVEQMRRDIIRNRLPAETRLISERQLADELEINRNTVHQAYEQLASEGLLRGIGLRGGGMKISEKAPDHYKNPFPSLNLILPYRFSEQLKSLSRLGFEIVAAIMDRAADLKISVSITALPEPTLAPEQIREWLESFIPRSIGTITIGQRNFCFDPVFEELLKDRTIPHVFVSGTSRYPHISSIVPDIRPGVREMLDCLRKSGHRNLCVLSQGEQIKAQFQNCAHERGLAISAFAEQKGMSASRIDVGNDPIDAAAIVDKVLALKPRPTALCAHNDRIAELVMDELIARGFRIPEDFSVTGYDDVCGKYELSTINHSRFDLGCQAVDILAELFDHGVPGDAIHKTVKSRFINKKTISDAKQEKSR